MRSKSQFDWIAVGGDVFKHITEGYLTVISMLSGMMPHAGRKFRGGKKRKELGRQKLARQNFQQQEKHAKLHSDLSRL